MDGGGTKVPKGELTRLRGAYRASQGPLETDESWQILGKLTDAIKSSLKRQYGNAPLIGRETEKMLRQNLVKKFPKDFLKDYAQWYFNDSDIDKDWRFNLPAFTSERFINRFLSETGREL